MSDAPRATVVLMRHGETAWNRERRVMGDLDIPLNEEGRAQCERAASLLTHFGIDRVVASPLVRAAESANIAASVLGVQTSFDERLVEVRFGEWQGLTYEEVSRDPRYHAFADDPVGHPTAGGETIADVQRRGLDCLDSFLDGECVLVVTHGDLIRSLLCHFLGTSLSLYRRIRTDNCGLSAIACGHASHEVKFVNVLDDPMRARTDLHWSGRK